MSSLRSALYLAIYATFTFQTSFTISSLSLVSAQYAMGFFKSFGLKFAFIKRSSTLIVFSRVSRSILHRQPTHFLMTSYVSSFCCDLMPPLAIFNYFKLGHMNSSSQFYFISSSESCSFIHYISSKFSFSKAFSKSAHLITLIFVSLSLYFFPVHSFVTCMISAPIELSSPLNVFPSSFTNLQAKKKRGSSPISSLSMLSSFMYSFLDS